MFCTVHCNIAHSSTYTTAWHDDVQNTVPLPYVKPSPWRCTLGFETCRRHHESKY